MGEALRMLRVFNDMKSGQLAQELGISASYLSEIETGKKNPSLDVIQKYADFFETTPSAIFAMSEGLGQNPKNLRAKLTKAMMGFLQKIEEHSDDEAV